jgi:hypothetical protein
LEGALVAPGGVPAVGPFFAVEVGERLGFLTGAFVCVIDLFGTLFAEAGGTSGVPVEWCA